MKKLFIIALIAMIAISCSKTDAPSMTMNPTLKAVSKFSVAGIWNLNKDYPIPYESPIIPISNKEITSDTISHVVTYGFTANNNAGLTTCTAIFTKNGSFLDIKSFALQVGNHNYSNKIFNLQKVDTSASYTVMLYIN